MKINLIAVALFSILGFIGYTSNRNELNINWILTPFVMIGIGYLIYYQYKINRNQIERGIINMIYRLKKEIQKNERNIEHLRNKVSDIKQRMIKANEIGKEVKDTIEESIELWEAQIELYERIIALCDRKISELECNKEEIRLLKHLLKQIVKQPNSAEDLKKLELLMTEIKDKLKKPIEKEISLLILKIKKESNRGNIIELHKRLMDIERKAG